jgi:hypothetical protein
MHDYRERLYVPLAWWLLAVPTVLLLGGTLYAGLNWPWPIIIIGGLAAGCAAILTSLGWARVELGGGVLRAGNAVLPVTAISKVIALDEKQTTRLRGPQADPKARLYSRPYLKESVYLAVEAMSDLAVDTAGGTGVAASGYWLVGTRHPAELATAIERCRVRAGHEPVA